MSETNQEQRDFWTDQAGPTWIAQMAAMDAKLAPVLDAVLARAALRPGEAVLDIGCGAGTSTQAAAERVGPSGKAVGADISQTLLGVARERAADIGNVSFELVDAQTHAFATATFDCLMSRFGVMFFSDTAAAFANMARALRPGGRISFATWGAIPENPFFTLPASVAKRVIGAVPRSDPDAPGPFALRDPQMVRHILQDVGLTDVVADVVTLDLTPDGDTRTLAEIMCEIGPAQRALTHFEVDDAERAAFIEHLIAALAAFETDQGLRIPACINFFTATKAA